MQHNLIHMYRHGFTLVETLVALSVLLLVIVGPMTVAQKGIQNARYAQEQLTAVFLAQEAIESVRELRDNQALNVYHSTTGGDTWNWMPTACVVSSYNTSGKCALSRNDSNIYSFTSCTQGSETSNPCKIMISSDGKYGTTGSETPFTRTIKITSEGTGAASVTVDVTWNSNVFSSSARTISLKTWIYDQYQRYE